VELPKKKDFWPRTKHTNKDFFLKNFLRGMSVYQKFGTILENKVVQKLTLENLFSTKNGLLNRCS
jgi:hypothetical protein